MLRSMLSLSYRLQTLGDFLASRVSHSQLQCAFNITPVTLKMYSSGNHQQDDTSKVTKKDHLQVTASQQRDAGIHEVYVSKIRNLSSSVKQLDLRTDIRPVPFSFKPGQWVDVFIPGVDKVGGFSMTSGPKELAEKGVMQLAVKYSENPPALWVHTKCREGDKLETRVGGDFFLGLDKLPVNKTTHIILIAGGVGINPLASMISDIDDHFLRNPSQSGRLGKLFLFYSAKTSQELIFKEYFDSLVQTAASLQVYYFLTASADSSTTSNHSKVGRITEADLKAALTESDVIPIRESEDVVSYICGPSSMITFAESTLSSLGVKSIYYENWWQTTDE